MINPRIKKFISNSYNLLYLWNYYFYGLTCTICDCKDKEFKGYQFEIEIDKIKESFNWQRQRIIWIAFGNIHCDK